MFQYIAVGFVIIVIICLIYYAFYWKSDEYRRGAAEAYLDMSTGTNDAAAQRAIESLNAITRPQARDFFARGRVRQMNVLENNLRAPRNRPIVEAITRDYANAMRAMTREQRPDAFILNNIEQFALGLRDEDILDDFAAAFALLVNTHAPAVAQKSVDQRLAAAVANSETRAEAMGKYFDQSVKYTEDRQNVHDRKIVGDLLHVLQSIREGAPPMNPGASVAEAHDYIDHVYSRDPLCGHRAQEAKMTLRKLAEGGEVLSFADTEDRIFASVWDRADHPENAENKNAIRESIVTSLADCVENGNVVCANGRCGRVLNSLVTLDFDPEISERGALTLEAYKNQIFRETKELVSAEINKARASDDPNMKAVGDAYLTGSTIEDISANAKEPNQVRGADREFKKIVERAITDNINRYADRLSPQELARTKEECMAYVAI